VLVEQLLNMLVGLVDTWLTGNYLSTDAHLAAIGLMAYVMWLLPSMFAAVAIGATAMTSRFVGSGDSPAAARVTNQAILAGTVLAGAAMAAVYFFGSWFVETMQLEAEAARLAVRYLEFLLPVIPAIMVQQVGIACLRGAGDTISGLFCMAMVNVVNVLLSTSLVTGLGPCPTLGWDGLAIGTATGHALGAVIVLGLLVTGRAEMRLRPSWLRPDPGLIRRLLRIGLPGGADVALILVCHLVFVGIINSLGTSAAAAHSLGVRIEALAYLPGAAFQVAAATLAGQFLGARDDRRAVRGALMACLAGGGIMAGAGVVMFSGAYPLAAFFTGGASETAQSTAPLLRIVSLAMPSLALSMILTGALRGAGDTRWPFLFTVIGFVGLRLPLATVLAWDQVPLPLVEGSVPGAGLGVPGAWYAMVIDVIVRSILVVWRFGQGGWKHVNV
jgi:putative MATE family efflux protein